MGEKRGDGRCRHHILSLVLGCESFQIGVRAWGEVRGDTLLVDLRVSRELGEKGGQLLRIVLGDGFGGVNTRASR